MSRLNKPFCEFCFSDDCNHCEKLKVYKQGREDALAQLLEGLSHFNDTKNGNEHFLYGIETCREMIEQMKGETDETD